MRDEGADVLTRADYFDRLDRSRQSFHRHYLAMYSSVVGGIVTDPVLMQVPVDDHLLHRGDGVFEMFKCVEGGVYNLDAHLDRLVASARAVGISLPQEVSRLRQTIFAVIRASDSRNCSIRVYLSRGPGSFGVNPYDSLASQLYIVVGSLLPSFMALHPEGATVITSRIPLKPAFFATMKHCNYLPNVLMKKEAVDAGAHFAAGFTDDGMLAEGATENFGVVTQDGALVCPRLDHVLRGTTMMRVLELADELVADGTLKRVGFGDLRYADIMAAREILIFGTTTDVTRVRRFDEREMPSESPVYTALSSLLLNDIRHGVAPWRMVI